MCPGLREWWLQNGVLNLHNLVIFNIYTVTVSRIPCRHFVLCKVAGKTSIYIHTDILVLVSELVVVVILSEWWLIYLSGGRCRPLPTTVGTSLIIIILYFHEGNFTYQILKNF